MFDAETGRHIVEGKRERDKEKVILNTASIKGGDGSGVPGALISQLSSVMPRYISPYKSPTGTIFSGGFETRSD